MPPSSSRVDQFRRVHGQRHFWCSHMFSAREMAEDNMTVYTVRNGFVPEPGSLAIDLLESFPEFKTMYAVEGHEVVRLGDMEINDCVDAKTKAFLFEVADIMDAAFERMRQKDCRLRSGVSNGPHWIWDHILSLPDLGDRLGNIFANYLVPPPLNK
jgi:hypothetical protein